MIGACLLAGLKSSITRELADFGNREIEYILAEHSAFLIFRVVMNTYVRETLHSATGDEEASSLLATTTRTSRSSNQAKGIL